MTKLEKMARDYARRTYSIVTPDIGYEHAANDFKVGFYFAIEMLKSEPPMAFGLTAVRESHEWAEWLESECAKEVE